MTAPGGTRLAVLTLALVCGSAGADTRARETRFEAMVTRVSDGDTVWVRPVPSREAPRPRPVRVRLVGLDAPERCQAHGEAASAALRRHVLGRRVTVARRATDRHGRALGSVWLEGRDVGAWLVDHGHAWSAAYRSDPGPYAGEERLARAARRGLFAARDPEPPRHFRRRNGPCEPATTTGAPRGPDQLL